MTQALSYIGFRNTAQVTGQPEVQSHDLTLHSKNGKPFLLIKKITPEMQNGALNTKM